MNDTICPVYNKIMSDRLKAKKKEYSIIKLGGFRIPKHLPSPPPLPEGYDKWEYRGLGWENSNVSCYSRIDTSLYDNWISPVMSDSVGYHHSHYIQAIKSKK